MRRRHAGDGDQAHGGEGDDEEGVLQQALLVGFDFGSFAEGAPGGDDDEQDKQTFFRDGPHP